VFLLEQQSLATADNGCGNRPLAAFEDSGQRLGKPTLGDTQRPLTTAMKTDI
jgi:hypothetical protein